VLRIVVDAEDRFLNSGDHSMHNCQGLDLAVTLSHDVGVHINERGELPGSNVDRAVASPVGGIMAEGHGLIQRQVGGNPLDHQVGTLDESPKVSIDAFSPVGRHGAVPQLFKPELQVQAVGDHPEVAGAMGEPN